MTQYMILIYETRPRTRAARPSRGASMLDAHNTFVKQWAISAGHSRRRGALQPTSTATRSAGAQVTDGPFVETKEALGGYYLVEARDLDQASQIAKLCPAPNGGVEVRPIMDTSTPPRHDRPRDADAPSGRRRAGGRAPPRVGLRAGRDGARRGRPRRRRGVRAGGVRRARCRRGPGAGCPSARARG